MFDPEPTDTPAVLIDLEIVQRNIARTQDFFTGLSIALRPHIKTHKLPLLAKMQIEAGAIGITCQKIGEAEVMADAGISDILITYNILGREKLTRLRRLAERCDLMVTADNATVVDGLSDAFEEGPALKVLVECDTGHGRCGVQSPEDAVKLAQIITDAPGLQLQGLMTYPAPTGMLAVEDWLSRAKALLARKGLPCPIVSSGGTPNLAAARDVPSATEYRAGTYIYNDRSLIERGACSVEDCALAVKAMIVSRPTADRAIVDAGSKILTSDLLGLSGYGLIPEAPGAVISSLSEEHGAIDLSNADWDPKVGQTISIIPNHACVVSNMVDTVHIAKSNGDVEPVAVAARGCIL